MIDINRIRPADLWYVVGYIATDGCLSIDGRHINITSKDREHLYKIKDALLLKNKIGSKAREAEKKKRYSYLQFGDVVFYKFLNKIGLTSKKSLTLGPLNVDKSFFPDFLRGVIDGDGNISTWIHKTNFHRQRSLRVFSASPLFIEWLKESVERYFEMPGKLYFKKRVDRKNGHYVLKYGKNFAKIILRKLYYDGCLSLERKFLQARLCLQEAAKMVN